MTLWYILVWHLGRDFPTHGGGPFPSRETAEAIARSMVSDDWAISIASTAPQDSSLSKEKRG